MKFLFVALVWRGSGPATGILPLRERELVRVGLSPKLWALDVSGLIRPPVPSLLHIRWWIAHTNLSNKTFENGPNRS